jgi:hypothetical protein
MTIGFKKQLNRKIVAGELYMLRRLEGAADDQRRAGRRQGRTLVRHAQEAGAGRRPALRRSLSGGAEATRRAFHSPRTECSSAA